MGRRVRLAAALCSGLLTVACAARPAAGLPDAAGVDALLRRVHAECMGIRTGATAGYIEALSNVDPEPFGIAIVTNEGRVFEAGESRVEFAIMSAAKPFTMALVLEQRGPEAIARIGVEPTGRPFNAVLTEPCNPLVNAGAIAATSLVDGAGPEQRWRHLLGFYGDCAGEPLTIQPGVLTSVRQGGARNREILARLEREGRIQGDPAEALELYNRQSCVGVTTVQLARMGATLANGGVNPDTDRRVLSPTAATSVLAAMSMAGMYDRSGAWAQAVGLPAKSGVGGGIVAVVPGRMAIAAFSPRLDEAGNSVRAAAAIRSIADGLRLSMYRISKDEEDRP